MKIYSAWSGHDCSFAVLNNGHPEVHAEYERYIREKEPSGDGVQFMFDELKNCDDIKYFATCRSLKKLTEHKLINHRKSFAYTRITRNHTPYYETMIRNGRSAKRKTFYFYCG